MSIANQHQATSQSVYRRGAEDGLLFGLYLSVLFIMMVRSIYSSACSVIAASLALAVPLLIFFLLRRSYRATGLTSTFSALWLQGICTFFFGSLLMALTAYIYLRFVNPSYMTDAINLAIQFYNSVDDSNARDMADMLNQMKSGGLLPTPGQTAVQLIWSGVFTGSLLSMILSAIIRATNRRTSPPPMNLK